MHSAKINILVGRQHFGFGDWLMMASAVKQIHVQRPDVQITVDVSNVLSIHAACSELWYWFHTAANIVYRPDPTQYAGHARHVVYPHWRPDLHFIEQMVLHIAEQCPVLGQIDLDPTIRVRCLQVPPSVAMSKNYILMPSQGALFNPQKEWGVDNFEQLGRLLQADGYDIVQIGRLTDDKLTCACERHTDLTIPDMVGLVRGSKMVVALENGLSHLAGHLQHPCTTLYFYRPVRLTHTNYVRQTPIFGERALLSPEAVYERIKDQLHGEKQEAG